MSRKGRIECTIAAMSTDWDYLDDGVDERANEIPGVVKKGERNERNSVGK
jgi:hypothetical protein